MSAPRRLGAVLRANPSYQRFVAKFPPLAHDAAGGGANIAADPGGVAADGLAFCATCRGHRLLRPALPLGHPDFGTLLPCPACPPEVGAARVQARLDRIWRAVPEHFRALTLDSFPGPAEIVARLRGWLDGPAERWLYLHGDVGRGKSGLAVALLRALVERGASGLFVVVPDLLERIRRTYRTRDAAEASEADVMASLYDVEVLVLDDLGAERTTDWVQERLFLVVGHRHDAHRRTILTSNLDLAELGERLHKRTASRIDELSEVIHMQGPNLRRRGAG